MTFIDKAIQVSFEEFADMYPLFPSTIWSTFHIIRDIIIKQEVIDITLSDGGDCGLDGYLIHCTSAGTGRRRTMIPWSADTEIDMYWLNHFLAKNFETEVYICIFSAESVIYELVETELC